MTNLLYILLAATVFVCGGCQHKLSKTDYEWMPYKGNETLVFSSNTEMADTIFLLSKRTLISYPEAQSPFGETYEVLDVFSKHSDPSPPDKKHRYLENSFCSISNNALSINLLAHDAVFYSMRTFAIDSLNKTQPTSLETKYQHYDDVYIFTGEDYLGFLNERTNFVTSVYWSKLHGLVRYDKKDTTYWELKRKYSP
jgi:hypothetical protein